MNTWSITLAAVLTATMLLPTLGTDTLLAENVSPPPSMQVLLRRLEATEQRLLQAESELQTLRTRDVVRQDWESPVDLRSSSNKPYRLVAYPEVEDCATQCDDCTAAPCDNCCPDCGKKVCRGVPHLCGCCLEGLSWNKAGGWRIVPYGAVRLEAIYSDKQRVGDPLVFFLLPNTPGGVDQDRITVHAKTSSIGFLISGPNWGSFATNAHFSAYLLNELPVRNLSGFLVLNAYAEMENELWRIRLGRDADLFSPAHPDTVNLAWQFAAGNLGWFRARMRVDRFVRMNEEHKWTFSIAASQPDVSDFITSPSVGGQDNGWPNIESRIGIELGQTCDGSSLFEIGASSVFGQLRAVEPGGFNQVGVFLDPVQNVSDIWGVNMDMHLRGERFGARGEVWTGSGAGTYFMAALQSLNLQTGNPIRSTGGWGEVYFKPLDCHTLQVGFAIDDPVDRDTAFNDPANLNDAGQTTLNQVGWFTWWWQPRSFVRLGFEVSHRETDYKDPAFNNDGMLYHTSAWFTF